MKTILIKCFTSITLFFTSIFGITYVTFLAFGSNPNDYKEGEYTMVYMVHYPYASRTYTIKNNLPISLESYKNTHFIKKTKKTYIIPNSYRKITVFETTSPIEVIDYTYKDKKYTDNEIYEQN